MRVSVLLLSACFGYALCNPCEQPCLHTSQNYAQSGGDVSPLWTPSSSPNHQDSFSSLETIPDHRTALERRLGFTGPMVFPRGHEGMFYIPPAPQHLPRPVQNAPQFEVRADEGQSTPMIEWTTSNIPSWNSPRHNLPGLPQSSQGSNAIPPIPTWLNRIL